MESVLIYGLGAFILALLVGCTVLVIYGCRKKDKKKIIIATGIFLTIVVLFYIVLAMVMSSI